MLADPIWGNKRATSGAPGFWGPTMGRRAFRLLSEAPAEVVEKSHARKLAYGRLPGTPVPQGILPMLGRLSRAILPK